MGISLPISLAPLPEDPSAAQNERPCGTIEILSCPVKKLSVLATLEKMFNGTNFIGQNVSASIFINDLGLKIKTAELPKIKLKVTGMSLHRSNLLNYF